ncbi:MBL fold metallo-hydrolase [Bacillus sp. BHET2]|uniref:MBL fold metallo-hydrolase n=1 Tax=Bacillus sp. BHET2 TaxID=2583818 RepID=UPI003211E914
MTTSAVIETDEAVIMTDPNWLPVEVETIKQYVDEILGDRQLYIIYTHSDFDHIIGSGAFPDAKVIATSKLKNKLNKEEIIREIHQFDQMYYLKRNYEPEYPSVDIEVSHDGQKLEIGSVTLRFYQAPGHTDDSLFTVIEPYGIFLSGDYLSDVEFPFIFGTYKDYVTTIAKVETILNNHQITLHVPGHGNTTENLEEIRNRLDLSAFYLRELPEENKDLEGFLQKEYPFYEGMKGNHAENIKVAFRE